MNLFELNYCPLCNSELNDGECIYSGFRNAKIEIFGHKFIDHFYYIKSGLLLFKENSIIIDLNLDKSFSIEFNNKLVLYEGIINIYLTLNNLEKIINFLNSKSEIAANNLLFL